MKVTKDQSAENRTALVAAAAQLFREHGIDGVGIAQICRHAGLTHGALYAHFPSKQALAAEALTYGLAQGREKIKATAPHTPLDLGGYLDLYLRDPGWSDPVNGCAMTASASEISRQDASVSESFCRGFEEMVETLQNVLPTQPDGPQRKQAMVIMATLIGAVSVARGVLKSNPALAAQVLDSARDVLGEYDKSIAR